MEACGESAGVRQLRAAAADLVFGCGTSLELPFETCCLAALILQRFACTCPFDAFDPDIMAGASLFCAGKATDEPRSDLDVAGTLWAAKAASTGAPATPLAPAGRLASWMRQAIREAELRMLRDCGFLLPEERQGRGGTPDAMAMTLTADDMGKLLLTAASSGDVAEIERLLSAGALVDWTSPMKNASTALILASMKNHAEAAELLIKHGANVNAQTTEGWSPLMLAAGRGHAEVGSVLLNHGADMDARDVNGNPALVHCSVGGFPDWPQQTLRRFVARCSVATLTKSHQAETEALRARVEHLEASLEATKEQMHAALAAKQKHMDSVLAAKQREMEVARAAHATASANAAEKLMAVTKRISEFKALASRC
ncbi:hypothetical protein FNF28_00757 [Cafeteria roenbergensis]|uniref:Uncharacterized protein n=3 Tax=Cafeteria roenbergensis TaxID=33653 RepID=A0A5A8E3Z2_CAFRO|nr:hypothetical protein FNF28_00757 [Cafeteria roenbergensis]